jgi:hypothetical protein
MRHFPGVFEGGCRRGASKGDSFGSFSLRLGDFGFRGRGARSLPFEPLCLQTLTVVRECLLCNLVLSHCLFGVDLAKCLTRIALGFGGRLWWLKPARRLCHFFAFSPISTASRASLSALRRLWFAWNSGSAWLSDIVCLDESGWRARRSSSSATCCSADRFGLIICFFPSAPGRPAGGSSVILPLQKHPYQENQGTNNPEEGLGILGPLPVLRFCLQPQLYKPTVRN